MGAFLISKSEMVSMQARIFDDFRTGAQVCYLIKRSENSKKFTVVLELTSGWFVNFDKFRDSMLLSIAATQSDFGDIQAQSSYVAYGEPDSDNQIDVYQISEEDRDRIPPTETSPAWKFLINRLSNERFTIPV